MASRAFALNGHIDLGTLRELREIMAQDFDELIEAYLSDSKTRIDDVRAAALAEDAYQLRELVHSLKGSCSNIGAVTMAEWCQKAETMAKEGELDGVCDVIDEIQRQFDAVQSALIQELGETPFSPPGTPNTRMRSL